MASKLVGYDSEESENAEEFTNERSLTEHCKVQKREADFAAEWENFEKLIACSSSKGQDLIKSQIDTDESTSNSKVTDASRKRIFREEVESNKSDSDMNLDSGSDDEKDDSSRRSMDSCDGIKTAVKSASSSPSVKRSSSDSDSSDSSDEDVLTKKQKTSAAVKGQSRRTSEILAEEHARIRKDDTAYEKDKIKEVKKQAVLDAVAPCAKRESQTDRTSGSRGIQVSSSSSRKTGDNIKVSETEDRIRAKLMAIADSPPSDVRKSRSRSPRDKRLSDRGRSPSPKSRRRSRDRGYGHSRHTSRRSRSRSHGRRRRSRSRSRSRSRDRHRRNRSRSRSGGRHHKSSRRHRSRDRRSSPRSRRSHERRKSRSRSPVSTADKQTKNQPLNFKEQLKAQLVNAAQKQEAAAAASAGTNVSEVLPSIDAQSQCNSFAASIAKMMTSNTMMRANEKPSNLPLNSSNPLVAVATGKDKVTPQQALAQTMAAMHQKVQELTGVAVPSYYNPAAVNPLKYAEQLKKRKLLWSKAPKDTAAEKETDVKTVQSVAQWTGSSFAADSDGKMAAKFRKLMGIKEEDKLLLADNVDISKLSEEQRRRQDELFQQLDKEYAFARMTTHTHRGIGLGFQSQGLPDP